MRPEDNINSGVLYMGVCIDVIEPQFLYNIFALTAVASVGVEVRFSAFRLQAPTFSVAL